MEIKHSLFFSFLVLLTIEAVVAEVHHKMVNPEVTYPRTGQSVQGRPGQQAAAELEPQRSVCRGKAIKTT